MQTGSDVTSMRTQLTVIAALFLMLSITFTKMAWAFPSFYPQGTPDFNYQVDLKGWLSYAAHLKTCRPAKWTLPSPIQIAMIKQVMNMAGGKDAQGVYYTQADIDALIKNAYQLYTIKGWEKGQCVVTIEVLPATKSAKFPSLLSDADLGRLMPITKINCFFAKTDITVMAEMAKKMVKENASDLPIEHSENEILMRSCQMQ